MNLGRRELGEWLPIYLVCRSGPLVEAAPVVAPAYSIYPGDSDTPLESDVTMPPINRDELTGHFLAHHRLGPKFSTGHYRVLKEWTVGTNSFAETDSFEIVGGGSSKGAYVGLFWYERPHAKYLIGQLDDGTIERRPSPRL